MKDELWRGFPRTLPEFEARFGTEEACRDYLVRLRFDGAMRCRTCGCLRGWWLKRGRWECADCGRHTSATAGTPFHRTRKPLRVWFRAIWEVISRRNGISARDLQRILGFGSYETAWTWLHKIRSSLTKRARGALQGPVQMDEAYVGGRKSKGPEGRSTEQKVLVLVAAEKSGRCRLEVADDASARSIGGFLTAHVSDTAHLVTDGWHGYSRAAIGPRPHLAIPQTASQRRKADLLQRCHHVIALLKRWWLGTHHGAVGRQHAQRYLDEFEFRFNRRKTVGVGRLAARLLEFIAVAPPCPLHGLRG